MFVFIMFQYLRLLASSPNASTHSVQTNVAEEDGRRSIKGRRRHHERSSSPKNPPGSSMLVATTPLLRLWLLFTFPRTMNIILWTGSPSLIICDVGIKTVRHQSKDVCNVVILAMEIYFLVFGEHEGLHTVTNVVEDEVI